MFSVQFPPHTALPPHTMLPSLAPDLAPGPLSPLFHGCWVGGGSSVSPLQAAERRAPRQTVRPVPSRDAHSPWGQEPLRKGRLPPFPDAPAWEWLPLAGVGSPWLGTTADGWGCLPLGVHGALQLPSK